MAPLSAAMNSGGLRGLYQGLIGVKVRGGRFRLIAVFFFP